MCLNTPEFRVPKAPEREKTLEERKSKISLEEERRRRAAVGGIQSTILTSMTNKGSAQTQGKTLLGQ